MQTECNRKSLEFHPLGHRKIVGRFDGGAITSDAGGLLLRECERATQIIRQFARCFTDRRDPEQIEHTVEGLVGQQVYGLALGYEDLNDHDALRRSGVAPGGRLGLYGFGASAHIVIQIARRWKCEVYVFTRAPRHQELARELGAAWVGRAEDAPPKKLDAAISFAPAGALVPPALRALDKGGTLALAGIAMSPVGELDYRRDLYHERSLTSVANATRQDARELLSLAGEFRIETRTEQFPLADANRALQMMKESRLEASAVLMP